MQVNLNHSNYKQDFGMSLRCHPQDARIVNYLESLPTKAKTKINELQTNNVNNPIDIFLSVIKKFGKERLKVEVGYKTFTEGYFDPNPVNAIKRGMKFADKLHKEQKIQNDLWKDGFRHIEI